MAILVAARQSESKLGFPSTSIVGSIGDFAREFAKGTEVPEEFYFVAGLTMFAATCSADLSVSVGMDVDTRFYTMLLGDSYSVKKSTAMRNAINFFSSLKSGRLPHVVHGVGSAEGLARELGENPRLVLALDEFRSFLDKTKVQSSVLLPMAASLFEGSRWDNATKDKTACVQVADAHLSIIGCCTTDTYETMWNQEAISIGFPNRLFLVNAEAKPKVAWPEPASEGVLRNIRTRIQQQLANLPRSYEISPDARQAWENWYKCVPESIHAKRLDTIGMRLLPVFALSMDKGLIDLEVVYHVTAILDYEFRLRMLTDPIDADNHVAKLEEKIRRTLRSKGAQSRRDLRRAVHADRVGIWAFDQALRNLVKVNDMTQQKDCYQLTDEVLAAESSPDLSPTA